MVIDERPVHMGMFAVKGQVYGFMGSSPVVISNPQFSGGYFESKV